MNFDIVIVIMSFSINPYLRKEAVTGLNDFTGYALVQTTTTIGNIIYLYVKKHNFQLITIKQENLQFSLASSALTILSSYKMNKLLKTNYTSILTTKIQVFTIISSYILDYLLNTNYLTKKQILGVFLMLSGIVLTKT